MTLEEFFREDENFFVEDEELEIIEMEEKKEKVSNWINENGIIRGVVDVPQLKQLEPGVYTVHESRDYGEFCKKINYDSDELFTFTDSITQELLEEIDLFWSKSKEYEENNLIHKRGIMLQGIPGSGKSSTITLLSNKIIEKGGVVFKISDFRNLDTYISFIRNFFRVIQPDTPVITILEDLDKYRDVEVSLLDFLDGKTQINHHVLITTSNNTEDIPDSFLRPSRIDLIVEINETTEKTREEYFKFKKVPEEDLKKLVKETKDCSLAELKEVYLCIYLLGYSLEKAVNKVKNPLDKENYLKSRKKSNKLGF